MRKSCLLLACVLSLASPPSLADRRTRAGVDSKGLYLVTRSGRTERVTRSKPQHYHVGRDMVAFIDATGPLQLWNMGKIHTLTRTRPQSYTVTIDTVGFVDAQKRFYVWYQGDIQQLSPQMPRTFAVGGSGTVSYVEPSGNFLVWHRGRSQRLSVISPKTYKAGPEAVVYVDALDRVHLWDQGQTRQIGERGARDLEVTSNEVRYRDSRGQTQVYRRP